MGQHRGGGPAHVQHVRGRTADRRRRRAGRNHQSHGQHRAPGRDRRSRGRRHRAHPHGAAAGPAAGAVHARPDGHRRRRARRAGLGLAAAEGRGQEDRLRRGPGGLRGLPGGRYPGHPGRDEQRGAGPARRSARLPGRRHRRPDGAAAGRRQRPVLARAEHEGLRRDQRDLRPRVPHPAADRAALRRGHPVGARPSTGPSCCPRAAATTRSASARTWRSATCPTTRPACGCTSRSR